MRSMLIGALLAFAPLAGGASSTLPRVMSTNLCADAMLLSLARPEQIVSLSSVSQDPARSSFAAHARRFPANTGSAEEVIAAQPDIVLASRRWQAHHQHALFERYGIKLVIVPFPGDWEGIFASTRMIGKQIGRGDTAEALLARAQARLTALASDAPGPVTLYLRPNGGTAGRNTHVNAVFEAAGLRNHAAERGRVGWGRMSLEEVIADPPDALVSTSMVRDTAWARAALSRHPQLQAMAAARPTLRMTQNDWGCSNWQLVESAEELAAGLRRLTPMESRP